MEERALTEAFDPLGIVASLVAHGVSYVLVGELAAQKRGVLANADRVDICVPSDQDNLVRLALALEQLGARQRASGSGGDHQASFDTDIGRLDLVESTSEFAAIDANATDMNIGRGVVAHVASLEDLARSEIASVDLPAATALLVALADAPEAEPPAGKKAFKLTMPTRAQKAEKAPNAEKAPKAGKVPKPAKAPKGEKAPRAPEAPKAPKAPKAAKADRPSGTRRVDRFLEKLESVDSFLTDVNAGKRSVGRKKD